MNDIVTPIRTEPHFALESEVAQRLAATLHEYDGRLSKVSAIGILELIKQDLMRPE